MTPEPARKLEFRQKPEESCQNKTYLAGVPIRRAGAAPQTKPGYPSPCRRPGTYAAVGHGPLDHPRLPSSLLKTE